MVLPEVELLGLELELLNYNNEIWDEPWLGLHLGLMQGGLYPSFDFHKISPETMIENPKQPKIHSNLTSDFKFERIIDLQRSNPHYFFSQQHKNNWIPYLRKLILARIFSEIQNMSNKVIIKDPVGSIGTDIISTCLPKSKLIFLVRDGRDVLDSRMDMHKPYSWGGLQQFTNTHEKLLAIAYYSKLWVSNMTDIAKGFSSHESSLKLLIKYEDLKKNTFGETKKIYDFIGTKISDEELRKIIEYHDFKNIPNFDKGSGKFNRTAKVGGWKENFSYEEKKLMNEIMNDTLKKYGYAV